MSTEPGNQPTADAGAPVTQEPVERTPDWWHRDHPTFAALTGFFTGLAFVIVVPGLFVGILSLVVADETAEDLFPFVIVLLAIPIGLMVPHRTRRFGIYMLIGVVTTALVVGGVAALVLWYMVEFQS